MAEYAILANPGHNRVYFESSRKLSAAELEIAAKLISTSLHHIREEEIAGIPYIIFETPRELNSMGISIVSSLSFTYAIFVIERNVSEIRLYPLSKIRNSFFDESVNTILKYSGKTNELFTRLLVNIAFFSGDFKNDERINLLDPVAGKGTTLFEGLYQGYNTYGIEISPDAVHEGVTYLKKYLENLKYKHSYSQRKISGENKSFTALGNYFSIARSKERLREGDILDLEFFAGDSRHANVFFKKNFFHVIAGDLPYGVQHGNVSRQKQSSFTRNPGELLTVCLPVWVSLLKPGGAIALSWNRFVLSRGEMEGIFKENGLSVLNGYPYNELCHRVDQAINRDIIVGVKL